MMVENKYVLIPTVRVTFAPWEMNELEHYAGEHYDGDCRLSVQRGGLVYGIRQADGAWTLTASDVDLLCKITEAEITPKNLNRRLALLLQSLNAEYRRLNE